MNDDVRDHEAPSSVDRRGKERQQHFVLMRLVQEGDERAFETLWTMTRPLTRRIVARVNHDSADTDEILQEAYFNIWLHRRTFDEAKGSVEAWVCRIAKNAALNSLRRKRASRHLIFVNQCDEETVCDNTDSSMAASDAVEWRQTQTLLIFAISQLSEERREVLMLGFLDGLSHSEISQQLGRPLSTVKNWMRRSLIQLRPIVNHVR